jgi:hypothetical protein
LSELLVVSRGYSANSNIFLVLFLKTVNIVKNAREIPIRARAIPVKSYCSGDPVRQTLLLDDFV